MTFAMEMMRTCFRGSLGGAGLQFVFFGDHTSLEDQRLAARPTGFAP